jgi:hypothetical protein
MKQAYFADNRYEYIFSTSYLRQFGANFILETNTIKYCSTLEYDLKGTMSRDFFTLFFFIKHLLLVPLDTPRKYFEFF